MEEYVLDLDKPRKLKFGFKADRLLTEKYGEMEIWDLKKKALQEFVYFAWAGLVWNDESLTVERVEQLLDEKIGETYTQFEIVNTVVNALVAHVGYETNKKKVKKMIPTKKPVKSPMKSA